MGKAYVWVGEKEDLTVTLVRVSLVSKVVDMGITTGDVVDPTLE